MSEVCIQREFTCGLTSFVIFIFRDFFLYYNNCWTDKVDTHIIISFSSENENYSSNR